MGIDIVHAWRGISIADYEAAYLEVETKRPGRNRSRVFYTA
jgi:hypothetical protein